jgi:hypothetical protein
MPASVNFMGNVAKSFILAAERCDQTQRINENQIEVLLVPAITNRAFSIELYLKTLLLAEGKEEEGHRLDKLYKKLSTESKGRILGLLSIEAVRFDREIEAISNTFVKWRYIYEVKTASLNLDFLRGLSYALKKVHEDSLKEVA